MNMNILALAVMAVEHGEAHAIVPRETLEQGDSLEQRLAYATEEWWEYLRGYQTADELVIVLRRLGFYATESAVRWDRAYGEGLHVVDNSTGKAHTLPQPY